MNDSKIPRTTMKAIELDEIVDAIEMQGDMLTAYLDTSSGKVVIVSDDVNLEASDEELKGFPDGEREIVEISRCLESGDDVHLLPIPDQFEVDEYRMMERFALACEDRAASDKLYNSIKGSGAFRRFKDAVHRLGIEDEWFKIRDEEYRRFAREWCEENNVSYVE